jgi:hypothetical protein
MPASSCCTEAVGATSSMQPFNGLQGHQTDLDKFKPLDSHKLPQTDVVQCADPFVTTGLQGGPDDVLGARIALSECGFF